MSASPTKKTHTLTPEQVAAFESSDARQEDALMADLRKMATDRGETVEVFRPEGFTLGLFEPPVSVEFDATDPEWVRWIETGSFFA